MSKSKPLPCPFCLSEKVKTGEQWDSPGGYVRCKCGAMMQKIGGTEQEAIFAWNTRPVEETTTPTLADYINSGKCMSVAVEKAVGDSTMLTDEEKIAAGIDAFARCVATAFTKVKVENVDFFESFGD